MAPSLSCLDVYWLTPDKPADISVGRRRLAAHLEEFGASVTLVGTTPGTVRNAVRERDDYDVVVGTTRAGAIAGAGLRELTRLPFVVDHVDPIRQFATTHPRWLAIVVERLENASFRIADHVLFVYAEEAARVRTRAAAATKTDLGVDVERFRPTPERRRAGEARLRRAGVSGKVVIYVGGLEPLYHIETLLESVQFLENWTLVLVGTGSLADRVGSAATSDGIVYLGTVDHETVPGLLQAADVGVSLVDDPHTLKVLEYGVAGLPVVQLAGRAEERFGDRVTYCDPDPMAVATAVERAADSDGARLSEFAREFDWRAIAETYAEVLAAVSQG